MKRVVTEPYKSFKERMQLMKKYYSGEMRVTVTNCGTFLIFEYEEEEI